MMPPHATWNHQEWIEYYTGDLTNSVNNDIAPLLPKALFGIPRQFFPYVEYLGGLVYGPAPGGTNLSNTTLARRFLECYMSRLDPAYGRQRQHLLDMWRHGLIHTYKPKVLRDPQTNRLLGWLSYAENPQLPATYQPIPGHVVPLRHLEIVRNPKDPLDWLPVSINRLVADLRDILALLAADLAAEQLAGQAALLDNMRGAAAFLAHPVDTNFTW